MITCPACSATLDLDTTLCPQCGYQTESTSTNPKPKLNYWEGARRAFMAYFFAQFIHTSQLMTLVVAYSWIAPWWQSLDRNALKARGVDIVVQESRWYKVLMFVLVSGFMAVWYFQHAYNFRWFLVATTIAYAFWTWRNLKQRRFILQRYDVPLEWWQESMNMAIGAALLGIGGLIAGLF